MVTEKLAWDIDVPLYDGHAKTGKLHKLALLSGIKLTKSYAPQRKSILAPKVFKTPERAVSFVGDVKVRKSAPLAVAPRDQKQSVALIKLGNFGRVSHNVERAHPAYSAAHKHAGYGIAKYHMASKQEKSFAPLSVKGRSFVVDRKTVGSDMQVQQHMGASSFGAKGHVSASILAQNQSVHQQMLINKHHMSAKGDVAKASGYDGGRDNMREKDHVFSRKQDFEDMLDAYFLRQSRLPPAGGTGVNPRLSPLWAGLKIPM